MMARRSPAPADQDTLFGLDPTPVPAPAVPPGFAYQEEIISLRGERELVEHIEALAFKPFEFHGFLGKRHVISFGFRYDFANRALRDSEPIPKFLLPLRQRAAEFVGIPVESLEQILINKYAVDAGIGWHRDRPMFQDVVAVSPLAPCLLRLRRKQGVSWERASLAALLAQPHP